MPEWLRNTWILLLVVAVFVLSVFGADILRELARGEDELNALGDPFEQEYGLFLHVCVFVAVSLILLFHLRHGAVMRALARYFLTLASVLGIALIIIVLRDEKVTASFVVTNCYVYGVALFIGLCDMLLSKWGERLTLTREEHWTKEIDYLYLTLGIIGVIGSMNKISQLTGQFSMFEPLAPVVLTTAVVLRFIKTRAEIGGWNKLEFYELP